MCWCNFKLWQFSNPPTSKNLPKKRQELEEEVSLTERGATVVSLLVVKKNTGTRVRVEVTTMDR